MSIFLLLFIFLVIPKKSECRLFARDYAALSAQAGDWAEVKRQLQELLIEYPNDAQILYDLGVAAYKLNECDQANAYFASAAQKACDTKLQEQAFFNQGNARVQQKKLQEAIDAYDNVLELNKENKQAQHNKEVVQKMLDEQNKQDQNKQDQTQDKDQQQEQKEDQQQNDQDQNKQDQQNQKQNNNENDQNKSDQQDSSDAGNEERSGDDQQNDDRDMNKDKEQEKESEQGKDEQKSEKDTGSKDDARNDSSDTPQREDGKDKRGDDGAEHTDSPDNTQKQNGSSEENDTQEQEKEQEGFDAQKAEDDMLQQLDAHLAHVLEAQEKKDADLNKQVIKMHVDKQLAGQSGQNRW